MKKRFMAVWAACLAGVAWAEPVSEEQARSAADGFLSRSAVAQRILAGRRVASSEPRGRVWIVHLAPSGYVEVAGSDRVAPVLGFSSEDFREPEAGDPMDAKLRSDAEQCAAAEADGTLEADAGWAKYTAATARTARRLLAAAPTGDPSGGGYSGYVAPLLGAMWNQTAPFNDLSPRGYYCGCMATAAGQEVRYWRWPHRYESDRESAHGVRDGQNNYKTLNLFLTGKVAFDWDKVLAAAPSPASTPWADDKAATCSTAFLSLWMQSLTGMGYKPGGSGGTIKLGTTANQYWYEFEKNYSYGRDGYDALWSAITNDLAWGSPIQVNTPAHQMVVDGYAIDGAGTDDEVDYINLNVGYGYTYYWTELRTAVQSGTYSGKLADFQIGYRPKKTVQFDPLPKKCAGELTLTWHLPWCYTNRVEGFTLEIAGGTGASSSVTIPTHEETTSYTATGLETGATYTFTVTPVMKEGEGSGVANSATTTIGTPAAAPVINGISSIACGIELVQQGVYAECAYNAVNTFTIDGSESVADIKAYSSHPTIIPHDRLSVAKGEGREWTLTVDARDFDADWWSGQKILVTLVAANEDGTETARNIMLRFNSMRQPAQGAYAIVERNASGAVWFGVETKLDAKGQAVTFDEDAFWGTAKVELTDSVGGGSFTFQSLDHFTGTLQWDRNLTVNLPSDMNGFSGTLRFESYMGAYTLSNCTIPSSATIDVADATTLNLVNATINAAVSGAGSILIPSGTSKVWNLKNFTGEVAVGDLWGSSATLTLNAGEEKKVQVCNGTLYLTLSKAQIAYGYSTTEITSQYEGFNSVKVVFQNEAGNELVSWVNTTQSTFSLASSAKVWTPNELGYGNFWDASRWSGGTLPSSGDYVIFKDTFDSGSEMYMNLSSDFTLGYIKVIGTKSLKISASSSGTATLNATNLENDIPTMLSTDKIQPGTVIPNARLAMVEGIVLACEIDNSIAQNLWNPNTSATALLWEDVWRGTVVFENGTVAGADLSHYGNCNSRACFSGAAGYLAKSYDFPGTVVLEDYDDATVALSLTEGHGGVTLTNACLSGSGTLKISKATNETVWFKDATAFTGGFDLTGMTVVLAPDFPSANTGASDGRLILAGEDALVASGKTWKAAGGLYLGANAALTVNGAVDASAITTYGDGASLAFHDGSALTTAAAMAGSHSPEVTFGAATWQFGANVTESKTVAFAAPPGSYTTLDANGRTVTLGAGFFSGSGDVYLTSSVTNGAFVIQGIPAAYTGTVYADISAGLSITGDISESSAILSISDIILSVDSRNLGFVKVGNGATLQVILTDYRAENGFDAKCVKLDGGTIEFLDMRGNSLGASTESTKYTPVKDYAVDDPTAPTPTAVWTTGEFEDEASNHGGYKIDRNGNDINEANNILIKDAATLGATIDVSATNSYKVSVLVKFKTSGGAPTANAVIASAKDSNTQQITSVGARCATKGDSTLTGYYVQGSALGDNSYDFSSPTIPSGEGYLLFSYYPAEVADGNVKYGVKCYAGTSIADMTGGQADGLQFRQKTITSIAIGGPASESSSISTWDGLEIEAIALFIDQWLSADDIASYEFPGTATETPEYPREDPEPGVIPGTVSQEAGMVQANVEKDAAFEWAVVTDTPIYFTVPSNTNIFTVAFDAVIPDAVGTLFGFSLEGNRIKVRRTETGTMVGLYNDDTAMDSGKYTGGTTVVTAGVHSVVVSYDQRNMTNPTDVRGTTVYIDGETVYHATGLSWRDLVVTNFSLGGATVNATATDVLAGLKVRNLRFWDGLQFADETNGGARGVRLNGETASVARSLTLISLFGLESVETNVTFAVAGIDATALKITPRIAPPLATGSLSVLGKANLTDGAWMRAKVYPAGSLPDEIPLTGEGFDDKGYRFFQLRAEEGRPEAGTTLP